VSEALTRLFFEIEMSGHPPSLKLWRDKSAFAKASAVAEAMADKMADRGIARRKSKWNLIPLICVFCAFSRPFPCPSIG
jgi:hypothetical protein